MCYWNEKLMTRDEVPRRYCTPSLLASLKSGPAEKNQFQWWGWPAVLLRAWQSQQTNKYRFPSALAIFLQSLSGGLNLRPLFSEDSIDAMSHKIWSCLSPLGSSARVK